MEAGEWIRINYACLIFFRKEMMKIESENPKNSYILQILVKISLNIAVFSYFSIPKKKNGINIAY